MRRAERLFQIIQILRSQRKPVTGQNLADELEISLRTLYRDIAELTSQRVPIQGEAGLGYVLDKDYDMPPLMLTADELEAAALGAAWVAQRGDAALSRGARDLIAKLTAVVPEHLRPVIFDSSLSAVTFSSIVADSIDVSAVRRALRKRHKLEVDYSDVSGAVTMRKIWPIAIAYAEQHRLIAAWCELRGDFRHFRTDRVRECRLLDELIPVPQHQLRAQWKEVYLANRKRPNKEINSE